jgi:XTP/dITP diphosphohydrolase
MIQQLLIATGNPGKLREFKELLRNLPIELVMPADLGLQLEVPETGESYLENAVLKAQAYASVSGLLCVADDSGLEVAALDGAPGIHSARYAPQAGATDADRRQYLLSQLAGKARPWPARFCCVVVIADPAGRLEHAAGSCPGEILPEERGSGGFGYDPIFQVSGMGRTMAELQPEEKNSLSHRARAVQAALPVLKKMLGLGV